VVALKLTYNQRKLIYKLLADGTPQCNVLKLLKKKHIKIDKSTLSRFTKKLIENGYLKEKPRYGKKPIIYMATERNPDNFLKNPRKKNVAFDWRKSGIDKINGKSMFDNLCNVHLLSFWTPLLRPPASEIKWDNTTTWKNGVTISDKKVVLDIGIVTFRRIKSKNVDKLVVFLPERYLSKDEMKQYMPVLKNYAYKAISWFQKQYKCELGGLPEIYQKPHFAFPAEMEEKQLARKGLITTELGTRLDESKAFPEVEYDDDTLALYRMEAPQRILLLEEKIIKMEETMNEIIESVSMQIEMIEKHSEMIEKTLGMVGELTASVERLGQNTAHIAEMLNIPPPKHDDGMEVQ